MTTATATTTEAPAAQVSPQKEDKPRRTTMEKPEERAAKRLKLVCPEMHEDLCVLLKRIASNEDATEALQQLTKILETSEQSDTAEAFFHSCGHATVAQAMRENLESEKFQKAAFEFLVELCNVHKACTQSLKGIEQLVSQGILDGCFEAIEKFPSSAELAEKGLWVVSNLLDALRFDTITQELGSLVQTLQVMKSFPRHGNVQAAACCILQNVADLECAQQSAFVSVQAVSTLAAVLERDHFDTDDYDCKSFASRAMDSIVRLRDLKQAQAPQPTQLEASRPSHNNEPTVVSLDGTQYRDMEDRIMASMMGRMREVMAQEMAVAAHAGGRPLTHILRRQMMMQQPYYMGPPSS